MRMQQKTPAAVLAGGVFVAGLFAGGVATAGDAAAATAYTVEPLNLNLLDSTPNLFGGAVCEVYDCATVPTAASLDLSHVKGVFGENGPISAGAATLNGVLLADGGEKLVFGYSQGAQVGGFWLRNYAPTTSVDRQNTSFLFVGDPENTYGVPWAAKVPTNSGFAVTEVWSQYDGWADWPARFDLLAAANAVAGMFLVHPIVYDTMDLGAEEADGNLVRWQRDGIDYTMVGNDRLPLLTPLRWVGLGAVADSLDAPLRAQIEAAYDRPSTQQQADAGFGAQHLPAAAVGSATSFGTLSGDSVALPDPDTLAPRKPAPRIARSEPAAERRENAVPLSRARASRGQDSAESRPGAVGAGSGASRESAAGPKRTRD
jgi:hypothetical protein